MRNIFKKLSKPAKYLAFAMLSSIAIVLSGCGKSGEIVPEVNISYQEPTIQNLQTKQTNIAKCTGGILSFTFDWISPWQVTDASAYLSFVRTIDKPITEPIGVMGSASEMVVDGSVRASIGSARMAAKNDTASDTIIDPAATEDFYRKYSEPILIPVRISTDEKAGQFFAQVPFTVDDIASAPLGVHQMMVYMKINNYKTNTLSFELTFVP